MPLAHPRSEILREEFLISVGLSARALAKRLDVPANRLTEIVRGTRELSADTAETKCKTPAAMPGFLFGDYQSTRCLS
jgi:addiction module HigA family antidote